MGSGQFYSVVFIQPNITNCEFSSEVSTICTHMTPWPLTSHRIRENSQEIEKTWRTLQESNRGGSVSRMDRSNRCHVTRRITELHKHIQWISDTSRCLLRPLRNYSKGRVSIWNTCIESSGLPLPMCLRVCSMVELRLTLDSRPRQKRFLLLDGSVKPSTRTLRDDAWNVSPTRLLSS